MTPNNLLDARSSVPVSTNYETAMGALSTSLVAQKSVGSMTEVARWANATAAGSDSITNITHTARADRIKTIIGTIPMITEATRTRGQFVIREYFLPHGLKASKKHAVNFWLRIATVIGLMIAAVLIWLFNRWLTRRRLLARQHASAEAETRATDWPSGIFPTSGGEIGLGISFGGEPPCLNNLRQKRY